MPRLNFHSAVDAYGGHGIVALELVKQLLFRGVQVDWLATDFRNEVYGVPDYLKKFLKSGDDTLGGFIWVYAQNHSNKNRNTVRYLVHETDEIPKSEIEFFNKYSLAVATPTHWNAKALKTRGYKHKVTVIPHGVIPDFSYKPVYIKDYLVFGTVGELMNVAGFRKNPLDLIKAFQVAFPNTFDDSVQLWIKTQPNTALKPVGDPRVKIFAEHFSQKQMHEWYSKLSIYVNPSRGEGWCMPMHEAMAVGRPFISTNWGGPTEYLTKESGWYLPHKIQRTFSGTVFDGQRQAQPDFDYLTDLMRWIYQSDRTEIAIKGIAATLRAHQFDWNTAGSIAYNLCMENNLIAND